MGRRDRVRKGSFWLGHPQVQTGSRLVPFSDRLLTSVLRSGCADPVRAQVPRTRPVCRAESKAERPPSETKPCLPIPCESFAGRATRVRPCSPPLPPGPDPPSTRAVLAAPLGVTRDTRKGRTRAPLRTPRRSTGPFNINMQFVLATCRPTRTVGSHHPFVQSCPSLGEVR